ncbi:MAG: DUF3124 domain-containing protein [Thermodesulfobacteriota bacterium]
MGRNQEKALTMRKSAISILIIGLALIQGLAEVAAAGPPAVPLSRGQTVYVPAYSHIYHGNREAKINLTVTLSLRNTSLDKTIEFYVVDYYNGDGGLVRSYLKEPLLLKPLSAVRYVIKESDLAGGSGASFLVKWRAKSQVNTPLIQAVMIGTEAAQGISFSSQGQVIEEGSE